MDEELKEYIAAYIYDATHKYNKWKGIVDSWPGCPDLKEYRKIAALAIEGIQSYKESV